MSAFNGAGQFIISGVGLPVVFGTTISSSVMNQLNTDLAAGLSNCLCKDGQQVPIANIPMGGYKLTGVGQATGLGDVLGWGQAATVANLTDTGTTNLAALNVSGTLNVSGALVNSAVSNPNLIINGDCRVSQYVWPITLNNSTPAGFTADRQKSYWAASGAQTATVTVATDGPASIGLTRSVKYTVGTVASIVSTDYFLHSYIIEAVDIEPLMWGTVNAKPATLSFWVKCSIANANLGLVVDSADNALYWATTYNTGSANTWKQITITIPGPTTGVWASSGVGLAIRWGFNSGSVRSTGTVGSWQATGTPIFDVAGQTGLSSTTGATWQITGIKLEVGSNATPFVPDNFALNFQKCLRYFEAFGDKGGQTIAVGYAISTTQAVFVLPLMTRMRIQPNITFPDVSTAYQVTYQGSNASQPTALAASVAGSSSTTVQIAFTMSGSNNPLFAGGQAVLFGSTGGPSRIYCDAEL